MQSLAQQFPESDWVVAQAAVAQYNLRNFDGAQELFEDLIERDPHRVEVFCLTTHPSLAWSKLHSGSLLNTSVLLDLLHCAFWSFVGPQDVNI